MSGTLQAGTRIMYNTTVGASIAAQAALAAAPGTWTVILNGISIDDVKPQETVVFDDSSLEDVGPVPNVEYRPGMASFTKKQNAQTAALRTLAAAGTKVAVAFVYPDGSLDQSGSCRFIVSSASKGTKGDFQSKIPESYQVVPDGAFVFQAHV